MWESNKTRFCLLCSGIYSGEGNLLLAKRVGHVQSNLTFYGRNRKQQKRGFAFCVAGYTGEKEPFIGQTGSHVQLNLMFYGRNKKKQNAVLPSVLRDIQGRREPFIGQMGRPCPVKFNVLWTK